MAQSTIQRVGLEARQFRSKHGAGAHLPEGLRRAAAQLAASQETEAILRELEISGETLRRWKQRYPAAKPAATRSSTPSRVAAKPALARPVATIKRVDVVEIKTSGPAAMVRAEGPTSAIEVTRPDGWTVRITGDLAMAIAATIVGKFTL